MPSMRQNLSIKVNRHCQHHSRKSSLKAWGSLLHVEIVKAYDHDCTGTLDSRKTFLRKSRTVVLVYL